MRARGSAHYSPKRTPADRALDGLTGISQGGNAADPGPTDLSRSGVLPNAGTTYELFVPTAAFDLPFRRLFFG